MRNGIQYFHQNLREHWVELYLDRKSISRQQKQKKSLFFVHSISDECMRPRSSISGIQNCGRWNVKKKYFMFYSNWSTNKAIWLIGVNGAHAFGQTETRNFSFSYRHDSRSRPFPFLIRTSIWQLNQTIWIDLTPCSLSFPSNVKNTTERQVYELTRLRFLVSLRNWKQTFIVWLYVDKMHECIIQIWLVVRILPIIDRFLQTY